MPRSRSSLEGLRLGLHALDVPVLYGAFFLAYYVRFRTEVFPPSGFGEPTLAEYQGTFAFLAVAWAAFLWATNFYDRVRFDFRQALRLGGQLTVAGGLTLALFFFRRDFSYSRLMVLLGFASAYLCLAAFHLLKSWVLVSLQRRGYGRTPAIVVGPRTSALATLARLAEDEDLPLDFRGYLGDPELEARTLASDPPLGGEQSRAMSRPYASLAAAPRPQQLGETEARFPRLGTLEDLDEVVAREGVQELFLVHPISAGLRTVEVLRRCEDTTAAVRLVPDMLGIIAHGVQMRLVGGVPVLDVGRSPLQGFEGVLKRWLDVLASGLGILALSPLFTVLALLVKRDSPGPVFYAQERVGMDGRPFTIFKFRSMPVDAEVATGPVWATRADPRATRFGAFIRKWSLDELPQLYNVLRGEMSLVGPRPERPHFVDQFRQDIRGYMQRHRVKAGITGWAQINGLRGECPIEERTRYDVWYIENWSLLLDLEILFRTFWLVAFHPNGD